MTNPNMSQQLFHSFTPWWIGATVALVCTAEVSAQNQQAEIRRLREELMRVEMKLELVRRDIPLTLDPAAEERFARTASKTLELDWKARSLPGSENLPLPDGTPSPVLLSRMEFSGRGSPDHLYYFFDRMGIRGGRVKDLEELTLERQDNGSVEFKGRFLLPTWNNVNDPSMPDPRLDRDVVIDLRNRLTRFQALLKTLESLVARFQSGRLKDAVAVLDATREVPAAIVTRASVGDRIRIRGVAAGGASRENLLRKLETGGFRVTSLRTLPSGLCRPFAIELARGTGPRPDAVFEDKLNDKRSALLCGTEPKRATMRVAATGGSSTGPITMHLRDVEVPAFFFVLHDLSGENFVVDEDARGPLRVDLEHVTLEEALAAMKSAGLVIGRGPLRRVSRAGKPPSAPAAEEYTGEPINLILQAAGVPDVLCLFSTVTSLPIVIPEEVRGRTSIYSRDLPWDRVLAGLLESSGLEYRIDSDKDSDKGTRLYAGPPEAVKANRPARNACEVASTTPSPGLSNALMKLTDFTVADIELAGVARSAEGWKGYVRLSGDRLSTLIPDVELIDGRVQSTGPAGVVLATAKSPVEIRLQP